MTLKVNIPRVVLNRPDEYHFSKERFPKLKTLVIEYLFECFGDAGDRADGDTTQFLDIISRDVTELVIRDLTRYRGGLRIDCEDVDSQFVRLAGKTLDYKPTGAEWTDGEALIMIKESSRSVTARSDRTKPLVLAIPPGHPPDERLHSVIIVHATF